MIDHETALLLAAQEIHEAMPADESGALEGHLATCPTCRRFASAMRSDDTRLRAVLVEEPIAPRVRRTVLDAAAGRRHADPRLILAVAAALLIGIIGVPVLVGGLAPAPSVVPSPSVIATGSPSPSPLPSLSSSPAPTAALPSDGSVNGDYAYTVAPGSTRRDSISAQLEGGPIGEWSRTNPAAGGGTSFGGPVTCLVIDGPDAWLAGPATTASDGSVDRAAFLFVHDGGPAGSGDTAVLWMNDPGQTLATMEGWCTSRFIPAGPYPVDSGDVTIVAPPD
jgi:hypothetical protein